MPGAGPDGASRLVARTMKFAHPRDVEVINSTLAPPTTCHTFTFNVSKSSALLPSAQQNSRASKTVAPQDELRGAVHASDLVFYGVTLTVWSHVDKARTAKLKEFKQRTGQSRLRNDSAFSDSLAKDSQVGRRRKTTWKKSKSNAPTDYTTSDVGMSDSDIETTYTSLVDGDISNSDVMPAYGGDSSDVFWLPYALTLGKRGMWHFADGSFAFPHL